MKKMVKGEITVFLSLVFLLLLTLVGALLESASIQLAKNERRADAGRAVESAFAEYQKDLLERYGIFAIEGSYESGTMSEENILNRLSFYGAENIETEIAAIRYLTDQNGKEFLRQAVEYEKMKTGAAAIENLTGKVSEWKEQELKAKLYPTATEKELAYYVSGNVLEPIGRDYLYSELVNPIFTKDGDNVKVKVGVKFLDNQTKATQISQYELVLHKDSNWKIVG